MFKVLNKNFIIKKNIQTKKAQTILEYALVVSVVLAALLAMGPYMQRLIQGTIKLTADQIGFQENADQDFSVGFLNYSFTQADTRSDKTTREDRGFTTYIYDDDVHISSNTDANLGFVESPRP